MAKKEETTKIQVSSRLSAKVGIAKDAPWYSFECVIEKSLTGTHTEEEVQKIIDNTYDTANENIDKQLEDAMKSNGAKK